MASGRIPVIRPGDVVVLDDQEHLFTSPRAGLDGGFSPAVLAPADSDGRERAQDVLATLANLSPDDWSQRAVGEVVLRLEAGAAGVADGQFADLAAALHGLATREGADAPGSRCGATRGYPGVAGH